MADFHVKLIKAGQMQPSVDDCPDFNLTPDFDFGSPGFVRLRERLWLATFEEAAARDRSFIFTFHPEASVRPETLDELSAVVDGRGGRVLFVELRCSEEEIERRLDRPSRRSFGKLRSVGRYRELRAGGAFDFPPLPAPWLRIDTGSCAPARSAERIRARLGEDGLELPDGG